MASRVRGCCPRKGGTRNRNPARLTADRVWTSDPLDAPRVHCEPDPLDWPGPHSDCGYAGRPRGSRLALPGRRASRHRPVGCLGHRLPPRVPADVAASAPTGRHAAAACTGPARRKVCFFLSHRVARAGPGADPGADGLRPGRRSPGGRRRRGTLTARGALPVASFEWDSGPAPPRGLCVDQPTACTLPRIEDSARNTTSPIPRFPDVRGPAAKILLPRLLAAVRSSAMNQPNP